MTRLERLEEIEEYFALHLASGGTDDDNLALQDALAEHEKFKAGGK